MPTQDANGRYISDDGKWWWDGSAWQPVEQASAGPDPNGGAEKRSRWSGVVDRAKGAVEANNAKVQQMREERRISQEQEAQRQRELAAQAVAARESAYSHLASTCPLPIDPDPNAVLPGRLRLQPDEFLVATAKDWGWSSQRLVLTTHRLIHTHGRVTKDAQSVYLTDVRDVIWRKPMMGYGTLVIDTASSRIEGLPAAKNGQAIRDQILALVHWSRHRAQQPVVTSNQSVAAAQVPDKLDQLKKLAELKAAGALTDAEFEREKAKLLS